MQLCPVADAESRRLDKADLRAVRDFEGDALPPLWPEWGAATVTQIVLVY